MLRKWNLSCGEILTNKQIISVCDSVCDVIYVDLYCAFSVAVEFDINQLFIEYCLHELGKYKQKLNHLCLHDLLQYLKFFFWLSQNPWTPTRFALLRCACCLGFCTCWSDIACQLHSFNPSAPGDFAEKHVLKLVEWFSGHCRAIKS